MMLCLFFWGSREEKNMCMKSDVEQINIMGFYQTLAPNSDQAAPRWIHVQNRSTKITIVSSAQLAENATADLRMQVMHAS